MTEATTAIDSGALPVVARRLIDALGPQAAEAVIREFFGRRVYVPKLQSSKAAARLAALVGQEHARRFIECFGGQRLDIPLMAGLERRQRDRAIAVDLHMSNDELVDRYRVTTRTIQRNRRASKLGR